MAIPVITTPRPPLNVFDAKRINVTENWQTIFHTPIYRIPAVGPNPERDVEIVALLTSLIITNPMPQTIGVSLRIDDGVNPPWLVLNDLLVPRNDFALIELSKQNLPSGEALQVRVNTGQSAVAHLSFVSNQREEFRVL